MINSTLGFVFTPDFTEVLLITKQRPAFHKGKLNGLGGKCEADETNLACITREVKEEAGITLTEQEWKSVGTMSWQEWHVDIFAAILKDSKIKVVSSVVEEPIAWYSVHDLPTNVLSNLPWLIPLSADVLQNDAPPTVNIRYA